MKKKLIALLMSLTMVASALAGCSGGAAETEATTEAVTEAVADAVEDSAKEIVADPNAPDGTGYKAAFITSTARGNEFIDLIWEGFLQLEAEGWEVKCIETFETAEQAEQVYALCQEGYNLIYTQGDDVKQSLEDIGDELVEAYPDIHFFYLDTYNQPVIPNATSVTIDPFEACFLAGYLVAITTEKDTIGIILPQDTAIMKRFEYGYYAGIDYANRTEGLNKEYVKAYTNSWNDTTKGYEAAVAMNSNYDIDTIIHCAYISGYGTISACSDLGLRCVGVDGWQGYIDDCVFWSAIKSMDVAVVRTAHDWLNGEEIGTAVEYSVHSGGEAYDERDLENLDDETREKVLNVESMIANGELDVFADGYEEYRVTDNTQ